MYEKVLGALAQKMSSSGGGGITSGNPSSGGVYVAPVGLNLGAILQTLNEGNPQTGGYGVDLISRLGYGLESNAYGAYTARSYEMSADGSVLGVSPWIYMLGAGALLLLFAMKKRRA